MRHHEYFQCLRESCQNVYIFEFNKIKLEYAGDCIHPKLKKSKNIMYLRNRARQRKFSNEAMKQVTKILCMNCTNESLHVTEKNNIHEKYYILNKLINICDVFKF